MYTCYAMLYYIIVYHITLPREEAALAAGGGASPG